VAEGRVSGGRKFQTVKGANGGRGEGGSTESPSPFVEGERDSDLRPLIKKKVLPPSKRGGRRTGLAPFFLGNSNFSCKGTYQSPLKQIERAQQRGYGEAYPERTIVWGKEGSKVPLPTFYISMMLELERDRKERGRKSKTGTQRLGGMVGTRLRENVTRRNPKGRRGEGETYNFP